MIIDMRLRPITECFLKSTTDIFPTYGCMFGYDLPESVVQRSMELCCKEMDEAGISLGVAEARWSFAPQSDPIVPAEDVVDIVTRYPDRFLGAIAINGYHVQRAIADAEKYVLNGPATGLSLELPFGFSQNPELPIDDKSLQPLFDYMEANDIPLFLTGGCIYGSQPVCHIDAMMKNFPNLRVFDLHGHVPYVNEIIHVALTHPNLLLCPDMYGINTHYTRPYVDAANGFLQDQIVFGSAYPFIPMKPSVEIYNSYFKSDTIREKIMYKNALRGLKLEKSDMRVL